MTLFFLILLKSNKIIFLVSLSFSISNSILYYGFSYNIISFVFMPSVYFTDDNAAPNDDEKFPSIWLEGFI